MKLYDFALQSLPILLPGRDIEIGWYIKLITDLLRRVSEGEIRRLIINMPPRSLKSTLVSVIWPAWILGVRPHSKIMTASYSKQLSEQHSIETRFLMQSTFYQNTFPNLKLSKDQNTKYKFSTNERGSRFATSIGGTLTGEGGDILIVDDPLSAMQANSSRYRERAIYWFEQAFVSRLNDRRSGAIVVVMQRVHSNDLTGHLATKGRLWNFLSLPLIALEDQEFSLANGELIHKVKAGDILCPNYDNNEINDIKIELGSSAFAAQYQQSPLQENHILSPNWIKRYRDHNYIEGEIYQSWDTSSGEYDFNVCTTWKKAGLSSYLIEVFREKLEYPQLKIKFLELAKKWQPNSILLEYKSSGHQLFQELGSDLPIIKVVPKKDKLSRFLETVALFESGKIFLPEYSHWSSDFESELFSFPQSRYDDQIDSVSQYLIWTKTNNYHKLQIRSL